MFSTISSNVATAGKIKRTLNLLFIGLIAVACQDTEREVDISEIERTSRFQRFDQAFFESDTARLKQEIDQLSLQFPEFFIGGKNMLFWSAQRTDPKQIQLYQAVQEVFDDPESLNENLSFSMKHFYYFYPQSSEIKFYAYISNLDFEFPVLFSDSVCFAALDLYLGPEKPYYQSLPEYIAFYRQPAFLVRDVMEAVISPRVAESKGSESLLDAMIYHGKKLYALERMMPQKEENIIVQYTPEELVFCRENERSIWAYFIENNHLFSTSQDLKNRFIELAPFSKFRMKFDRETPGMIGRWIGWQIVREYMENNDQVSLPELLKEDDSRKILKHSGYKP